MGWAYADLDCTATGMRGATIPQCTGSARFIVSNGVPGRRSANYANCMFWGALDVHSLSEPGVTLPVAAAVVGATLMGVVLQVVAKKRSSVRRRFTQTLELRIFLLIVLLLASWPVPTNSYREAIACGALILLSFSLAVGFDGTLLGPWRIAGLIFVAGAYLSLDILTYYHVDRQITDLFRSYQFQLASASAFLYFMLQPIIANHDANLDGHMESLREHAKFIRELLEWKNQNTKYLVSADGRQTRLVVPIEKVRPDLEKRIKEGKEIVGRIRNYGDYGASGIRAEHWYWHTRGLLERWFSRNDVAEEFVASRGAELRSYRDISSDNSWRVRLILENQITCIEGILRRLDVYDLPISGERESPADVEPPKARETAPSYITYRFSGPVGQLIAGEGQTVRNINSHIAAVVGQGQEAVGEALVKLSEAALSDPQLDDASRAQILESIEDLADAAESAPNERKSARIRGAIQVIGQVASVATQLGEVWNQWGPVITQHLRLQGTIRQQCNPLRALGTSSHRHVRTGP